MKITEKEILHVANLARLDLPEESIPDFARQIGEILDYVDTLNMADTKGVPPTFHAISLFNAFREDNEADPVDRERIMANAPEKEDGHFIVPTVIE
jgi:aspartyl-tRNA(Asn)/glutamyl-tRNA(Gln) amidotransferase subunit C